MLKKQIGCRGIKFRCSKARNGCFKGSLYELAFRSLSTNIDDKKIEPDIAPAGFKDRWKMIVPAVATHISIGSAYAVMIGTFALSIYPTCLK